MVTLLELQGSGANIRVALSILSIKMSNLHAALKLLDGRKRKLFRLRVSATLLDSSEAIMYSTTIEFDQLIIRLFVSACNHHKSQKGGNSNSSRKHECVKLKFVSRVTGLIIIELSQCTATSLSYCINTAPDPCFEMSQWSANTVVILGFQHYDICEILLELLKVLSSHARVQGNLIFFRVRRFKNRASLENSSTNHL